MSETPIPVKRGRGQPRRTGVKTYIRISSEDYDWWRRELAEQGFTTTGLFAKLRAAYLREQYAKGDER